MTNEEAVQLAEQYVLEREGDLFKMIPHKQHDNRFVFYFLLKRFLETGAPQYQLVGPGPVILNKTDGRFFRYSSSFSPAVADEEYQTNIRNEAVARQKFPELNLLTMYALTVSKIEALMPLIQVLKALRLTYILPEVSGTQVLRLPKRYTRDLLDARLADLPVTFGRVSGAAVAQLTCVHLRTPLADFSIQPAKRGPTSSDSSSAEAHFPEW